MNNFVELATNFFNSAIIITLGSIGLKTAIDYLNNKNTVKHNIYTNQFNNVYLNLFQFMEPYLYKNISIKDKEKIVNYVNNLIKTNYIDFFPSTLSKFKLFQYSNSENLKILFDSYCSDVDFKFEFLKSKLLLPKRDDDYRLVFNQLIPSQLVKIKNDFENAGLIDIIILILIILIYVVIIINFLLYII